MITLIVFSACLFIVIHNVLCIASMNPDTAWSVWVYHAMLCLGSFWMIMQIVTGFTPSFATMLILVGIAGKYLFERRKSARLVKSHS